MLAKENAFKLWLISGIFFEGTDKIERYSDENTCRYTGKLWKTSQNLKNRLSFKLLHICIFKGVN